MRLPSICRIKAFCKRYKGSIGYPLVFGVTVYGWYKLQDTVFQTGQDVDEINRQHREKFGKKTETETVKNFLNWWFFEPKRVESHFYITYMYKLTNLIMLKKPVSKPHPIIERFFNYFARNKFRVFAVSCLAFYVTTLPFAQWFEGDISAKRRAEERAKGNERYAE